MCGVTSNSQDGFLKVNDLKLKDNGRTAMVSYLKIEIIEDLADSRVILLKQEDFEIDPEFWLWI